MAGLKWTQTTLEIKNQIITKRISSNQKVNIY